MKRIFPLILLAFAGSASFAQESNSTSTAYPPCDASERIMESIENDPQAKANYEGLKAFTKEYAKNPNTDKKSVKYIIPIVFHVIYSGNNDVSMAQIEDAVRIINEDFQKLNPDSNDMKEDFKSIVGDPEIEFRLATIDPDGNCTQGVTHHESEMTFSAGENVKDLEIWPVNMYLNVWVVQNIASGAGAYAYYPGTAPGGREGIVCRASQLGGVGQSNGGNFSRRTLTHEIGHYLNLPHTWGNSNNNAVSTNCTGDDGVSDTPNTIGSNQNCNLNQTTCGTLDNVENYMDYATCSKMFTEGQKVRMHAALEASFGGRNNLWKEANLIATGTDDNALVQNCAPVANFFALNSRVCQGTTVTFTDISYNSQAYTRNWNFEGADVQTSSDSIVSVSYSNPGTYDVSLTVTNAEGTDSYTKTDAITIVQTTPDHVDWMQQDFADGQLPNGWSVYNPDGVGFEYYQDASLEADNSGSIRLRNRVQGPGALDELYLPVLNLNGTSSPKLTFYHAFARKTSSSDDQLIVYVSTNCGQSWIPRKTLDADELATVANQPSGDFVPSGAGDWKQATVNLSAYRSRDYVHIKLAFTAGFGNNLYLDKFIAGDQNLGLESLNMGLDFDLFPNPSNGDVSLAMNAEHATEAQIRVVDLMGKTLRIENVTLKPGANQWQANWSDLPTGVYVVQVITAQGRLNKRIVIQ